ncbi:MAG: hypothetical protein AAF550_02175 [Myxococcota bacterium]
MRFKHPAGTSETSTKRASAIDRLRSAISPAASLQTLSGALRDIEVHYGFVLLDDQDLCVASGGYRPRAGTGVSFRHLRDRCRSWEAFDRYFIAIEPEVTAAALEPSFLAFIRELPFDLSPASLEQDHRLLLRNDIITNLPPCTQSDRPPLPCNAERLRQAIVELRIDDERQGVLLTPVPPDRHLRVEVPRRRQRGRSPLSGV